MDQRPAFMTPPLVAGEEKRDLGASMHGVSTHAHYLLDIGDELRRLAEGAASQARANREDAFFQGRASVLYAVVSLMQQQAEAFSLPMEDLRFDGLDADRDLL
jgi:hypothetical protein